MNANQVGKKRAYATRSLARPPGTVAQNCRPVFSGALEAVRSTGSLDFFFLSLSVACEGTRKGETEGTERERERGEGAEERKRGKGGKREEERPSAG